jgi:hypothetical protein
MKALAKFEIFPRGDAFVLQLEDDAGGVAAYAATVEQLDALIEAADGVLEADDADQEAETLETSPDDAGR